MSENTTTNQEHIGENMSKTPPTTPEETHHQYYAYGSRIEEWIEGEYIEPWFWATPTSLPYSRNFWGFWEGLPSENTISVADLEYFKKHAKSITKEEYERLLSIKQRKQEADSDAEYRYYGPR